MHSRSLLHKVSKSSGDCALVVDKHHRGSRTHHKQHLSPHLVSRTPRTTPRHHHKNPSSSNQWPWSLRGAPEADQEEEQGCQEEGARWQQGVQPNQIKQDKTTTRTGSRGSRRALDQSLIPTSFLQKSQQQGEQARTSSNICSYHPSKKIRGAIGLPSGWHSGAMLDSSQGRNQIKLISVLIQYLPQPLHHWPNKANQQISVLISKSISICLFSTHHNNQSHHQHQKSIADPSSQSNTNMHTLLEASQEIDKEWQQSFGEASIVF
jgi:hypothetical protein